MRTAGAFDGAADLLQFLGAGRLQASGPPDARIDFRAFAEVLEKDIPVGDCNISEWIFARVGKLMATPNIDLPTLKSDLQKQMVSSAQVLRGVSNLDEMKSAIGDLSAELRREGMSTLEFTDSLPVPLDRLDLRAFQLFIRCLDIHKKSPLVLIEDARNGDRNAVLALVKIDKMFLHDICSQSVITEAERRGDRAFFQELGRAVSYIPRPSNRRVIRCLLYVLFALGTEIPLHADMQEWFDHDGTIFGGVYAFDKFARRCRKEFDSLEII